MRKNLIDKFPYMVVAAAILREMQENCEQTFVKPRNRTLDRYKFFARKQKEDEALRQFWNVLTGLAPKCEFGDQTNSLILDAFIQNINNETVQQRLCTDPKDIPDEALRFAVVFEEGISQLRSFGREVEKIKDEPICSNIERPQNPFTRCRLEFVQNHLSTCEAKDEPRRNCGGIGHFARIFVEISGDRLEKQLLAE